MNLKSILSLLLITIFVFLGIAFSKVIRSTPKYKTIADIPVPPGYERITLAGKEKGPYLDFGQYLRHLPLKQDNNTVYLYNGQPKQNQSAHFAVINIGIIGKGDLQQCADAVMRLRAEYLRDIKNFGIIPLTKPLFYNISFSLYF